MKNLAKNVSEGLRAGDVSVSKLGIDHATAQRIYRRMKKDNYSGQLAFYVCEKIAEETLDSLSKALDVFETMEQEYPLVEELAAVLNEESEEVLYCCLQALLPKIINKKSKYLAEVVTSLL